MQKVHLWALFALLSALFTAACAPSPSVHELSGEAWGTTYRVKIVASEEAFDEAATTKALRDTLVRVDNHLSNWNPASEVSRFNAQGSTEPVAVSPAFASVLAASDQVHRQSEGFFDVTLAPVIELWGFGSGKPGPDTLAKQPGEVAIREALARVGQTKVIAFDPAAPSLRKADPGVSVFLSALAKGAGIDAIDTAIRDLGHTNYLIEVGGDLIAKGPGPSGQGWRIAIEQPVSGARQMGEVIALNGIAMATSGDYRNYFEEGGVRYSHIIDPQTGKPITHRTASVTVLSDKAVLADAWATALLAAGEERGRAIAAREGIAALFISRQAPNDSGEFASAASPAFEALRGAR
ncbi:MAG: FAD:protein FMN transferase [Pseudomonadota bacterium]